MWQRGFQQSGLSEAATHQEAIVRAWWPVVTICCSLTSNQTKQSSPLLALSLYLPPTFYRSGSSATWVGGWTCVTSTSALSTKCMAAYECSVFRHLSTKVDLRSRSVAICQIAGEKKKCHPSTWGYNDRKECEPVTVMRPTRCFSVLQQCRCGRGTKTGQRWPFVNKVTQDTQSSVWEFIIRVIKLCSYLHFR